METILVAGAGKSSAHLIQYLIQQAPKENWNIIVADGNLAAIEEKTQNSPYAKAVEIDITNSQQRQALVQQATIVVSLMPPHLHIHLAKDCLQFKKNLITSSYISPEMRAMDAEVRDAGLMYMCEMGLDPGIDHMTANQIIHSTQKVAATITSFKSYCGGLIAPESDDNPWHYKFSWNPKNIITAGLGGAQFLENGQKVITPYESIFHQNKSINVEGVGALAYYPNRDSLSYLDVYDVPEIETFLRATLRYPDFCIGWNSLIQLGLTNENDEVVGCETLIDWVRKTIGCPSDTDIKQFISQKLKLHPSNPTISLLQWLGLFSEEMVPKNAQNSGAILLDILLNKWAMKPSDKDMVVMQHEVKFNRKGVNTQLTSTMVLKGDNRELSAMSKTVGLPMAVLTHLILKKKVALPHGVHIPNMPSIYNPVLKGLSQLGIHFKEEIINEN